LFTVKINFAQTSEILLETNKWIDRFNENQRLFIQWRQY